MYTRGLVGVGVDRNPAGIRGLHHTSVRVTKHMSGIVSYRAIVTLSLRRVVVLINDFKNVVTLKSGSEVTQGLKVVPFDRLHVVSY